MKKVIFTLIAGAFMVAGANAQFCGTSGINVCAPSGTLTEPGLAPNSTALAPVVNCTDANTTIQFKNFTNFDYNGTPITIDSLRIDGINNLPGGTCWATSTPRNTFASGEDGCIKVTGTVAANPGQYKLEILVTAYTAELGPLGPDLNADEVGLAYFVRVKNNGDADVEVDTLQEVAFAKPAGYAATIVGCTGINEVESINALNVVPNPFSTKAVVVFNSDKNTVMTERLSNMLGAVVYKNTINVKVGANTSVLEANNLPAGVYFYSVSDGKQTSTRRVVISE